MPLANFHRNVVALAKKAGLEYDPQNVENPYQFDVRVDDLIDLSLVFNQETDELSVIAVVGRFEPEEIPALMENLLAANLRWVLTGEGYFGVDHQTRSILYVRHQPSSCLGEDEFDRLVERFLRRVEFARKWLADLADGESNPELLGVYGVKATDENTVSTAAPLGRPSDLA